MRRLTRDVLLGDGVTDEEFAEVVDFLLGAPEAEVAAGV